MKRYIPFFEKEEYLTLYHGTDSLYINDIKSHGIVSKMGYDSPQWYMLSSNKQGSIFHSTYVKEDNRIPYLVTLRIPIDPNLPSRRWKGYPYVWAPHQGKGYKWYALRQEIPKEFIYKIEKINIETWYKVKQEGF